MTISEQDIVKACEIVGVKPETYYTDWKQLPNSIGESRYRTGQTRYPAGLDLLNRLEKGLDADERVTHFYIERRKKLNDWRTCIYLVNGKSVYMDKPDKLESFVAAILEMGREQS